LVGGIHKFWKQNPVIKASEKQLKGQLALQICTFFLHNVNNAMHCLMSLQSAAYVAWDASRKYDVYGAQCNDANEQFHSNYLFGHNCIFIARSKCIVKIASILWSKSLQQIPTQVMQCPERSHS